MQETGHRHEKIKLDQTLQQLFKLSNKVTIQLINGLFGESFYELDVTDIHYEDSRFTLDNLERLEADLYITLRTRAGVFRYHIEFQTLKDSSMIIRMFKYGLEKAIRDRNMEMVVKTGKVVIKYPQQRVIFLEENKTISDTLSMHLRFDDGQELEYCVPVVKYWTYSAEELRARRLYALLPLQVFNVRAELKRIQRSKRPEEVKKQKILEQFQRLKDTIHKTLHMLNQLYEENELLFRDMEQMMKAATYITEHLYAHYDPYPELSKEVNKMWDTLIDPKVWKDGEREGMLKGKLEGKFEVARNMLKEGLEISMVARLTRLSEEEVERLLVE
ncbi:hypothetical protein [Paenibacillus eucommiae]|uniref:Transposase n=1 Tax=Paenibacillus eucommiae TaxID=1355755 RepID=A0ABS4J0G7_9BACL|nr:hypothetical protein [Paenibacillus eucommiae]MBP1993333.1 hypothetical protein [Paenibacillus eucommiae]